MICLNKNLTLTVESVALVSREAGAHEAPERIRAMRKDITGPVLAFVLIYYRKTRELYTTCISNQLNSIKCIIL